MHTGSEHPRSSEIKREKLISVLHGANKLLEPKNYKLMLKQTVEMRTRMMECAALSAIFAAQKISEALRPYVCTVSDKDARSMIDNESYKAEDLTISDGKIMTILQSSTDRFRYEMIRTVDRDLRKYSYKQAYDYSVSNDEYRVSEVEEEGFHFIVEEACDLENMTRAVVLQPQLRALPSVRKALMQKHSLEDVVKHGIATTDIVDALESAWTLEPSV